jgi:glycine cleavage system aminomethyltransferase T
LRLEDPEVMMWGGELLVRDGVACGQVTSAAWSATFGTCVGLAYLWRSDRGAVIADFVKSGRYEVNVGGSVHPATVSLRPLYDPSNQLIRAS